MSRFFQLVESVLRARTGAAPTSPPACSIGDLLRVVGLLGAFYGLCMGLFGFLRGSDYGPWHLLAVAAKVPALFLLTLAVTAPSLYVFSALARSELRFRQTVHLLLSATALSGFILGSAPWHNTDGDSGSGEQGTLSGSGATQESAAVVTVSGGGSKDCVWICCPFPDGSGCPSTDQCP